MNIDDSIKKYIELNILPEYDKNIGGHDRNHIISVVERSFEIIKEFHLTVDNNLVYVIAVFHDIGYKINPDEHEQVSAEIMKEDNYIKQHFSKEQIKIMYEAIVDHRASLEYEPRSIYGKIVSSADRETNVKKMLERSFLYQKDKHKKEKPTTLEVIEYSYKKLISKYGNGGYAKMYYPDKKYRDFLEEMQYLFNNKEEFIKRELEIAKNS